MTHPITPPPELVQQWIQQSSTTECTASQVATRVALEAQPEPQGPSDEELHQLWLDLYAFHDGPTSGDVAEIARAVLARWGRPAIEPVPVSERLPGPEDCDAEGRCWFGTTSGYATGAIWIHRKAELRRSWDTHWLSHWALPVPGVEGDNA